MQVYDEHYYLDPLEQAKPTPVREEDKPKPKAKVKMPYIRSSKNAKKKVIVTEDWYLKKKRKQIEERVRDKKEMQLEMIQLLSKRDRIRFKLGELDLTKKKDVKKQKAYLERLEDIDAELKVLEDQSGIKIDELDRGSKLGRFFGRIKRGWKRFKKKVKKVYERNETLIVGIASVVLPIVGGIIIKAIIGLFA